MPNYVIFVYFIVYRGARNRKFDQTWGFQLVNDKLILQAIYWGAHSVYDIWTGDTRTCDQHVLLFHSHFHGCATLQRVFTAKWGDPSSWHRSNERIRAYQATCLLSVGAICIVFPSSLLLPASFDLEVMGGRQN